MSRIDPAALIQSQVDAYNAHDLETFLAAYADDVVISKDGKEVLRGKPVMRERYGRLFSENPQLRCRVLSREAQGDSITDDEPVTGTAAGELRASVRYDVGGGLISRVAITNTNGQP